MKQTITVAQLEQRIEAGERIYANAGVILQRCAECKRVQDTRHFVRVPHHVWREFVCAECIWGVVA